MVIALVFLLGTLVAFAAYYYGYNIGVADGFCAGLEIATRKQNETV